MNKLNLLCATSILSLLMSQSSQAAPVTFVAEGDLILDAGIDTYNLNGAHFKWVIEADTTWLATTTSPIGTPYTISARWNLKNSGQITYTNRPDDLADSTTLLTTWAGSTLMTRNSQAGSPSYNEDLFGIGSATSSGEFDFFYVGFVNYFDYSYYSPLGVMPLPSSLDKNSVQRTNEGARNQLFYNDAKTSYYRPVNWTLSTTSPVPVPAAAWLFGSGLLGLVAVARRKTNA